MDPEKLPVKGISDVLPDVGPVLSKVPIPAKVEETKTPGLDASTTFDEDVWSWFRWRIRAETNQFIQGKVMTNDLKTTVSGLIAAVASLLGIFGVVLSPEVAGVITAVAVLALGYFTNKPEKPS